VEPPAPDLTTLVSRLDEALPWTGVGTTPSPATIWCEDVRARAETDPLSGWRRVLEVQQGSTGLPHVAAAFVLQWWCEVAATPIAYAARLGPVVLSGSPGWLGFELAPQHYPARLVLDPDRTVVEPVPPAAPASATEGGRAAYLSLVSEVVRDFAPEIKMSTRQRWGVVDDVWHTALARAAGRAEPWRASCCFIYALPGMQACARCPRSAATTDRTTGTSGGVTAR
jgi:hypothetical protein